MIDNKLIYFKTNSAFQKAKTNPGIANTSIAFIEDTKTIYTHGVEYNTNNTSYIDAVLAQYVTKAYLNNALGNYVHNDDLHDKVMVILNGLVPSWSQIAQLYSTQPTINAQLQAAIRALQQGTLSISQMISLLNSDTNKTIAKKIFDQANENGSNVYLDASHVAGLQTYIENLVGDVLDIDEIWDNIYEKIQNAYSYLKENGIFINTTTANNIIRLTNDYGLQHKNTSTGRSSLWIKSDGSGFLGYVNASSTNPAIKWDKNGVVSIDPSLVPSGGGSTETSGIYTDVAFKATTSNIIPALPDTTWPEGATDGTRSDGWARYAQNSDGSKVVWMATRRYTTDGEAVDSSWNGPWQITGPEGEAGADGKSIEFVYTQTNTDTVSQEAIASLNASYSASASSNFQQDDYTPSGWNDNAQGISENMQYEWIAIRTKRDGTWSRFSSPILWSHWGQNGVDGDGIEYIYYASTGDIPAGQYPNEWREDQTREYTGPAGSQWQDDPIDLAEFGQGAKEWVSIRKRDGETGLWGRFSEPALWTSIARDGIADGYIVDLTNGNMPVGTNSSGAVASYTNSTDVQIFHNGVREAAKSVTIGTIRRSDNEAVGSSVTANVTTSSSNSLDKTITININSLTNFSGVNLFIPVQVTLNDENESVRTVVITCYGTVAGADGQSIELCTNTAAINYNYAGSVVVPENVEVWAAVNGGPSSSPIKYYPADSGSNATSGSYASRFTFEYAFDGSSTFTTLLSNTIGVSSTSQKHTILTVRLKMDGKIIDVEQIPFVSDGVGIPGASAVNYDIRVVSTSLVVSQNEKINGSVYFVMSKRVGAEEATLITTSPYTSMEELTATVNGKLANSVSGITLSYSNADGAWVLTARNITYSGSDGCAAIYLRTAASTLLASAVVPFIMSGTAGVRGDFKSTAFTRYNGTSIPTPETTGASTFNSGFGTYEYPIPYGTKSNVGNQTWAADEVWNTVTWSDGIPNGTGKIWATSKIFKGDGTTTQWSTPQVMADSDTFDVEFSPVETDPGTPTNNAANWYDPEDDVNVDWATMVWRAERKMSNGIPASDWTIIRIKGEKGEKGDKGDNAESNVQSLTGVVIKFSSSYDSNTIYSDGSVAIDGIRYKDVVLGSDNSYYTPTLHNPSVAPSSSTNQWKKFEMSDAAYIETLIASSAYINSLTSKQVVITNNDDKVVAGMISGNRIPTEMRGTSSEGKYINPFSQGVRIFAGAVPETGNVADAAFTVDSEGNLKANGTGSLANGNITWNTSGDITANSITINNDTSYIDRKYSTSDIDIFINSLDHILTGLQDPEFTLCYEVFKGGIYYGSWNITIKKSNINSLVNTYSSSNRIDSGLLLLAAAVDKDSGFAIGSKLYGAPAISGDTRFTIHDRGIGVGHDSENRLVCRPITSILMEIFEDFGWGNSPAAIYIPAVTHTCKRSEIPSVTGTVIGAYTGDIKDYADWHRANYYLTNRADSVSTAMAWQQVRDTAPFEGAQSGDITQNP